VRLHPDEIRNRVPGVPYDELMLEPDGGSELRADFSAATGFADEAPPRAVPGRPWHVPC